jgi:tetratricopeptide (TPR) repeat protein
MKRAILGLALAFTTPVFAVDTPTVVPPTMGERMDSARQFIAQQGWSRAQFDLKAVVDSEPGNADAHNLLAYTYRKQDIPDLARAFEHYKTALQLNPEHKGAHEYIGEAYLMARQPELAAQHLVALEKICGNRQCEEYQDLATAIAAYRKANPDWPPGK